MQRSTRCACSHFWLDTRRDQAEDGELHRDWPRNPEYDPTLAKAVTLANRRKVGADDDFDQRQQPQQPAGANEHGYDRADVAQLLLVRTSDGQGTNSATTHRTESRCWMLPARLLVTIRWPDMPFIPLEESSELVLRRGRAAG